MLSESWKSSLQIQFVYILCSTELTFVTIPRFRHERGFYTHQQPCELGKWQIVYVRFRLYVDGSCKKRKELLPNRAKEVITLRKHVWVAGKSSISSCITANWGRERYIGCWNTRDRKRKPWCIFGVRKLKGYEGWTTKGNYPVFSVGVDSIPVFLTNAELCMANTLSDNSHHSSLSLAWRQVQ